MWRKIGAAAFLYGFFKMIIQVLAFKVAFLMFCVPVSFKLPLRCYDK